MTAATSASAFAAAGRCGARVCPRGLRVECVRIYPKGGDGRGAAAAAAAAASSSAATAVATAAAAVAASTAATARASGRG